MWEDSGDRRCIWRFFLFGNGEVEGEVLGMGMRVGEVGEVGEGGGKRRRTLGGGERRFKS